MTKGDKILIVIVSIISLISIFIMKNQVFSYDEKFVSIQVNGEEVKKIFFDKKIEGKTFPIETDFGYNLIEIGNEKVRVIDADCPDKLDVKKGWIETTGDTIVCLPNKMVVEIKGQNIDKEIDYMSR